MLEIPNASEEKLPYYQKLACMLNRLDGSQSISFSTLLICLQSIGNDFGRGNVSRDVSYAPRSRNDLLSVSFACELLGIQRAIKKVIGGDECVMFWYNQL